MDICLTFVFNHRFDRNIQILKQLYKNRFACIRFIVPFYDGNDKDVIAVYESSYYFQGFFVQALERLLEVGAEYYLFIADDLVINPNIDQTNAIEFLKMKGKEVFIDYLSPFNTKGSMQWTHTFESSQPFFNGITQWESQLPSIESALRLFKTFFGKEYPTEYSDDFFADGDDETKTKFLKQNGNTTTIPYPLARGYADIMMVSAERMKPLFRTFGIFAAMKLFVEIAIPTAIVLDVDKEKVVVTKDTGFKRNIIWGEERIGYTDKYGGDLQRLLHEWDKEMLFVHPIKLSKWKCDN